VRRVTYSQRQQKLGVIWTTVCATDFAIDVHKIALDPLKVEERLGP